VPGNDLLPVFVDTVGTVAVDDDWVVLDDVTPVLLLLPDVVVAPVVGDVVFVGDNIAADDSDPAAVCEVDDADEGIAEDETLGVEETEDIVSVKVEDEEDEIKEDTLVENTIAEEILEDVLEADTRLEVIVALEVDVRLDVNEVLEIGVELGVGVSVLEEGVAVGLDSGVLVGVAEEDPAT
jgi:hypothetical protein